MIVIPGYREEGRIGRVVTEAARHGAPVLVVDDGSPDRTGEEARAAGATVVRHEVNRGKGAALATGFRCARERGAEAVIALDADGQHDPAEIAAFMEAYERTKIPVLVGNRMWDTAGMPLVRRLTNRFMSWMLSREMKQYVPDTQCGFRLTRSDVIPLVAAESERFAAESETLLRMADRGVRIGAVRIRTIYRDEKSKINPVTDTIRFIRMIRRYRAGRRRPAVPPAG
jgi:glycosyltransferase involved in cell wall biosynthesis